MMVELRSVKAQELIELAHRFRVRAADCPPDVYRDLILRTAGELEELAQSLVKNNGSEFVLFDDEADEPI